MNWKKTILLLNSSLVAAAIYLLATYVFDSSEPAPVAAQPPAQAGAPQQTPSRTAPPPEQLFRDLADRNLLTASAASHTPSTTSEPQPVQPPASPPPAKLNLSLQGTIAGPPDVARAIIHDPDTGRTRLYRTGDRIADATIETIDAKQVTLRRQGQQYVLSLQRINSSAQPLATSDSSADTLRNAAAGPSSYAALFENLIRETTVELHTVNDRVEGLRISGLENVPAAAFLNLHDGDILTQVNGQQLTNKQKAFQVLRKARNQAAITLDLLRDNKPQQLTFRLQ